MSKTYDLTQFSKANYPTEHVSISVIMLLLLRSVFDLVGETTGTWDMLSLYTLYTLKDFSLFTVSWYQKLRGIFCQPNTSA